MRTGRLKMINEILFMETRIFREFCRRNNVNAEMGNNIFNSHKIWQYIESCYDILHMNGDDYVINDIDNILKNRGVVL